MTLIPCENGDNSYSIYTPISLLHLSTKHGRHELLTHITGTDEISFEFYICILLQFCFNYSVYYVRTDNTVVRLVDSVRSAITPDLHNIGIQY